MDVAFDFSPQLLKRINFALQSDDPWIKWHENLMHWADDAIDIIINDQINAIPEKVLDIATGTSAPLFKLLQTFCDCKVDACDIDKNLLELGNMLIEEKKVTNIKLLTCNAEELIYPSATYDLVICLFSIMYFKNPNKAVDNMLRVMKSGSKAYIVTWGEYNALFQLVKKVLNWDSSYEYDENKNPHIYSDEQKIMSLFDKQNLRSLSISTQRINLNWKGSAVSLWQFFKASNKAIENHFYTRSNINKENLESKILIELNSIKPDKSIDYVIDFDFAPAQHYQPLTVVVHF